MKSTEELNKGIEELVYEVVRLRKELKKGYCVDAEKYRNKECDGDCEKCEEKYYRDMYNWLINHYSV